MSNVTYTDQMGDQIRLNETPKKIVSLVPSITELLFDLGLDDEIVGITRFCKYPAEKIKNCTVIGGTKKVDFEQIDKLAPDLIIGNKEENEKGFIEKLKLSYSVWMSDIFDLSDVFNMIQQLGFICNRKVEALLLSQKIRDEFNQLKPLAPSPSALYFIWRKPYMVAGKNTFIDKMLTEAGFHNLLHEVRYPEMSVDQLKELKPDYVLLSSEPFPFQKKHIIEFQKIFPNAIITLVDGELFSWCGSRLQYSPAYFRELLTH